MSLRRALTARLLAIVTLSSLVMPVSVAYSAGDRVSVLVTMQAGADRAAVRSLAATHGAKIRYEYRNVLPNTLNIRDFPAQAVEALRKAPGVRSVTEDVYHEDMLQLDESTPLIHGLQEQIQGAGFNVDGSGVRVCVVDTGVATDHVMYADRVDLAASYDFVNNDTNPADDEGHGTHVAGTVLGGTGLTVDFGCEGVEPFQGVAPAATLIAVKVLDASGGGLDSDVAAGIDHCVDPALPGGPADVINLSLGGDVFPSVCDGLSLMADAANDAVAAGAVVVAAAGNGGQPNGALSPACGSNVIAVGATYKDSYPNCENPLDQWVWCFDIFCFDYCLDDSPSVDDLVCFSNQSNMVDVVAPGCSIWSADFSGPNYISDKCGTSMATPHVAGLAAILLDQDPNLTPAQVRRAIRDGAVDLGPAGYDPGYGYGRIDVLRSLATLGPCESDAACDDGNFCNGADACTDGACLSGSDPCPGQLCDELLDECYVLGCNGNGVCDVHEDCVSCPSDCASNTGAACGNGVCEAGNGEDCLSCPDDCAGQQSGRGRDRFCCGDGDGSRPVGCNDSRCGACTNVPAAASCCGDGTCQAGAEDGVSCEVDCGPPPVCGDGICHPDEVGCGCLEDCGTPLEICGNGIDDSCDGLIDCEDPLCLFDASCSCLPVGLFCTVDSDCCTGKCVGGALRTCR